MFRYQDDCIIMNDSYIFASHFDKIYPKEMILKKTNVSRDKVTFLDLTISIYKGKFIHYNYDKRRDFNFEIVNYPDLSGNIPHKSSYGTYVSQLVRFTDVNYNISKFKAELIRLTETFLAQGFNKLELFKKYLQFCDRYLYRWSKFNMDIKLFSFYSSVFKFKNN